MAASRKGDPVESLRFLLITRGVVAVLFGIFALVWPQLTVATFAILVAVWLFVEGVINVVRGVMGIGKGHGWIFTMLLAVVQLGVGAYLIQRPALTAATMVALIAIALVVQGVVSIIVPLFEGKDASAGTKTLTVFVGVLSLLAGILIWRYPVDTALAFVWVLGLYSLITGPIWIAMGLDVKE